MVCSATLSCLYRVLGDFRMTINTFVQNLFVVSWFLPWASEGFFPGGLGVREFFQNFSEGGHKWWNFISPTRN